MTIPQILNHFPTDQKAVAFTFDDGPNPQYTPQVLDIFRQASGKATFFMLGNPMEKYPEIVQAVHEQGHEIGNHTYSHSFLTKLEEQECLDEILKMQALITETTGSKPAVLRPPYFDCNEKVAALAGSLDYMLIGAVNGGARDWEQPGVQHIIDATLEQVEPGSILLFHDGFGDRSHTIEAVRQLVKTLSGDGYQLVTVSTLKEMSEGPQ